MARIDQIRLKIERAKHHINDLDARVSAFREANPNPVVAEYNPHTNDRVYRAGIGPETPSEFSCILGDAIHNLRSTLDHLAWQLVEANGGKTGRQTMFPIQESAAKYMEKSPTKVKGMSQTAISFIDGLKPYKGGNDNLWLLHDLDITDKHKLLIICVAGKVHTTIVPGWARRFIEGQFATGEVARYDPHSFAPIDASDTITIFEKGAVLQRIPGGKVDDEVNFTLTIAFGKPQIIMGKPIVPFLHQLAGLVGSIVDGCASFL